MTALEALMTGQLLGLLLYQREKSLTALTPRPVMLGDDYSNVIEMKDHLGRVRLTITVEEIGEVIS